MVDIILFFVGIIAAVLLGVRFLIRIFRAVNLRTGLEESTNGD